MKAAYLYFVTTIFIIFLINIDVRSNDVAVDSIVFLYPYTGVSNPILSDYRTSGIKTLAICYSISSPANHITVRREQWQGRGWEGIPISTDGGYNWMLRLPGKHLTHYQITEGKIQMGLDGFILLDVTSVRNRYSYVSFDSGFDWYRLDTLRFVGLPDSEPTSARIIGPYYFQLCFGSEECYLSSNNGLQWFPIPPKPEVEDKSKLVHVAYDDYGREFLYYSPLQLYYIIDPWSNVVDTASRFPDEAPPWRQVISEQLRPMKSGCLVSYYQLPPVEGNPLLTTYLPDRLAGRCIGESSWRVHYTGSYLDGSLDSLNMLARYYCPDSGVVGINIYKGQVALLRFDGRHVRLSRFDSSLIRLFGGGTSFKIGQFRTLNDSTTLLKIQVSKGDTMVNEISLTYKEYPENVMVLIVDSTLVFQKSDYAQTAKGAYFKFEAGLGVRYDSELNKNILAVRFSEQGSTVEVHSDYFVNFYDIRRADGFVVIDGRYNLLSGESAVEVKHQYIPQASYSPHPDDVPGSRYTFPILLDSLNIHEPTAEAWSPLSIGNLPGRFISTIRMVKPSIRCRSGSYLYYDTGNKLEATDEPYTTEYLPPEYYYTNKVIRNQITSFAQTGKSGRLYVSHRDLAWTTDMGESWTRMARPGATAMSCLIETASGTLVAGLRGYGAVNTMNMGFDTTWYRGGIYYSTDDGGSWVACQTIDTNAYIFGIRESANGVLWAASSAVTYDRIEVGMDTITNTGIRADHDNHTTNGLRLFRSADGGRTWEYIHGFNQSNIHGYHQNYAPREWNALPFAVDDTVVAFGFGQHLYVSTDKGATWSSPWTRYNNVVINSMEFDDARHLWLATSMGLYKLTIGKGATSVAETSVHSVGQLDVYPNPAWHEVNVRYSTTQPITTVNIYNILGLQVQRLDLSMQQVHTAGSLTLQVDDLLPGMYRIEAISPAGSFQRLLIISPTAMYR